VIDPIRTACRAPWLICISLLAAGCDLPGKPDPKDRPLPAEKVLVFEALYTRNCAACHGKDGKQGPAPPLNDPLFRAIVPVTDLEMVLSAGRTGTPMPPFAHREGGPLSAAQVQVLVHEIKGVAYRIVEKKATGLSKAEGLLKVEVEIVADAKGVAPRWGAVSPATASVPSYSLPQTKGNEEQGAKLFARACASCHGPNGEGFLKDDKRLNKINDPAFLALISDQALRRIIITGRPDLKMPDYSQKTNRPDDFQPLTSAEIADLGALLSSWRQGKSSPTK
jgi:cytochrome c oxidase cbb3-type subunit III